MGGSLSIRCNTKTLVRHIKRYGHDICAVNIAIVVLSSVTPMKLSDNCGNVVDEEFYCMLAGNHFINYNGQSLPEPMLTQFTDAYMRH